LDRQRGICGEMKSEQRLVMIVADERVELVVFLLLDLVLIARQMA